MQLVSGLATSYLGSSGDAQFKSQGQNLFSRVFPRGLSFRLLPWSYLPVDIWLDTFQVRVRSLDSGSTQPGASGIISLLPS